MAFAWASIVVSGGAARGGGTVGQVGGQPRGVEHRLDRPGEPGNVVRIGEQRRALPQFPEGRNVRQHQRRAAARGLQDGEGREGS